LNAVGNPGKIGAEKLFGMAIKKEPIFIVAKD